MKPAFLSAVATASLLAAGCALAPAASADPGGPQYGLCNQGNSTHFYVSSPSTSFKQANNSDSSVTGGPGVTLSISRAHAFTMTGTLTGTISTDVNVIIASVGKSVAVSVALSRAKTVTVGGSWTVPSSYRIGRLAVGAMSYSGSWRYYYNRASDCAAVTIRSGTYKNLLRNELHFQPSKVA